MRGEAQLGDVNLLGRLDDGRNDRRSVDRPGKRVLVLDTHVGVGPGARRRAPYDDGRMPLPTFAPSADGRVIAGVCAGIAQALAVDVTLVRLVFALLALAGGAGIVLYLALWAYGRAERALVGACSSLARRLAAARAPSASPTAAVGRDRARRRRARARVAPGRQRSAPTRRSRTAALALVGGGAVAPAPGRQRRRRRCSRRARSPARCC